MFLAWQNPHWADEKVGYSFDNSHVRPLYFQFIHTAVSLIHTPNSVETCIEIGNGGPMFNHAASIMENMRRDYCNWQSSLLSQIDDVFIEGACSGVRS